MKSMHLIVAILLFFISSCGANNSQNKTESIQIDKESFSIKSFIPIINYGSKDDNPKLLNIDFNDAIQGIEIPSITQTTSGYFTFNFHLKNNSKNPSNFYYKIYYQNETYKFPESLDTPDEYFLFQEENFYGSWNDSTYGFKKSPIISNNGEFHLITDSFRIVGNPRFEERYYSNGKNDKWKRNPRVGQYEFMLVVCTDETLNKHIPQPLQNIHLKNDNLYVNPFDFFKFRISDDINDLAISGTESKLKIVANIPLKNGIYIDSSSFDAQDKSRYYCETCGVTEQLRKSACFEQFKPFVAKEFYFDNIPVIADVENDEFDRVDYYWYKSFIPAEERVRTIALTPRHACETIKYKSDKDVLAIKNPACTENDLRKEIAGVRTRHGFTYGKYQVKCKLPKLLNSKHMWNGLTNAIWLLGQSNEAWNARRLCKNGFIPEYMADSKTSLVPTTSYSEIDIEIMKAQGYCPSNTFPPFFRQTTSKNQVKSWLPFLNEEFKDDEGKVHITCTNWDMGCKDPSRYKAGCVPTKYGGNVFESFRYGTESSRGVTGGSMEYDSVLFGGPYFYFEIDWQPNQIIWRIGPEKNNMHEVCYMDSSYTTVPNNQMILIIDQEFHNTKWWIGAIFDQWNIPFPAKEIEGLIYEVTIE